MLNKLYSKGVSALSLKVAVMALICVVVLYACKDEDPTVGAPRISGLSPSTGGPVGTYVKILGSYFSTKSDVPNIVKFNGVQATVISAKNNELSVVVPSGASTGKVTVQVGSATGTSSQDFTVSTGAPAPVIIKLSPETGLAVDSTIVTITGYNFSTTAANNIVKFNGTQATDIKEATATSIKVRVPYGARTGKVTVDVKDGASTVSLNADLSTNDFTVPGPSITSFTPSASIVGSTVVISGANFSDNVDYNTVEFNGVEATVVSAKSDQLTVLVPSGATKGKIKVTVDGQSVTSKDDFTVNP
jgi:hypothetical protein